MIDIRPDCPVCGAVMGNPELHQKFHDGLREIARRIEAPDSTPEEYEQAIREQWEREGRPVTRTEEPPPATVKRGSNCPVHGEPLLWLGDGELMCQEGHSYQIPVPQTGKTRAKR